MIPLEQIESKALKEVIGEMNNSGLITPEQKIRPVGVSKADQIKKFTEVFEALQEKDITALAEKCQKAVAFFHHIYKDELDVPEGTTPAENETEVEPEKEEVVASTEPSEKEKLKAEKAAAKAEKEAVKEKEKAEKEAAKAAKIAEKEAKKEASKEERASRKGMQPDEISAKAKDRYVLMNTLIGEGTHTKKEIIEVVKEAFPDISTITIATNLSDSKNPKYNKLEKLTKETEDGKFVFID